MDAGQKSCLSDAIKKQRSLSSDHKPRTFYVKRISEDLGEGLVLCFVGWKRP